MAERSGGVCAPPPPRYVCCSLLPGRTQCISVTRSCVFFWIPEYFRSLVRVNKLKAEMFSFVHERLLLAVTIFGFGPGLIFPIR